MFAPYALILRHISSSEVRTIDMNNSAFRALSYGVYILSTWDNGKPTGCTVNSVMQITSSPATIAVSVNKNNYTHDCILKSKKFAVSVLHEQSSPDIISVFGFSSGRDTDKFSKVDYAVKGMMPVVANSAAYIVCDLEKTMETNTHTVFLGKVADADVLENKPPMTYAYYHNVVKGKTAKNAPTYIEEKTEKGKWVCSVCGYVYDGEVPFEELPDDFRCPVCKQPKSAFVKK